MVVFWRLGYEKASTEMLMKTMGIARQSLYDTLRWRTGRPRR
jgi:hypothetical protein